MFLFELSTLQSILWSPEMRDVYLYGVLLTVIWMLFKAFRRLPNLQKFGENSPKTIPTPDKPPTPTPPDKQPKIVICSKCLRENNKN